VAIATLPACVGNRVVNTYGEITSAEASIREARDAGADEKVPQVLRRAEQLALQARRQLDSNDFDLAHRSAEEAKALADLAATGSRVVHTEEEIQSLRRDVANLQAAHDAAEGN
jgi:hypothetical protein